MQIFVRTMKVHTVLLLSSMLLFTNACEDDDHDGHEGHTDAEGFILEDESGNEVYREFEGAMSGSITLSVGETLELSVHFLDHDGEEIEHDDDHDEDESSLDISENNTSIATVVPEEHEGTGDDHHGKAIEVTGVSAGSTNFKLRLMHDGHADYTSTNNVPITVN